MITDVDHVMLKQVEESVRKSVERFAHRIGSLLVRETVEVIDRYNVRATADLRKSITYELKIFGTFIVIKVFSPLEYVYYAHEGRKPGRMPPIDPIQRWVKLKGIAGRYSLKTRRRLGGPLERYNQDNRMAWAIAKKIAQHGTKGVKFFDLALRQAMPRIERELQGFGKIVS